MSAEQGPLRPIAVIGAFPPPVNGYAVITSSVEALLRGRYRTFRVNISPGTSNRGVRYHATRVSRVALAAGRLLWLRMSAGAFDTYIATESRAGLFYTIALAALARALGGRLYLHHHVFRYVDRRSRMVEMLLTAAGKNATHIFLCQCMRSKFAKRYKAPTNSVVVSNLAFATLPGDRCQEKESGPLTVGLLSNLTREKGLYAFLELAAAAKRECLPVRFVLAGPADNKEDAKAIAGSVKEMALSLSYLGPVYGDDKRQFYRDIDVFVFPTTYANEAQPMVIFEALASGSRVIAYDRACIAEQIAGRGWIVPSNENFVEAALKHLQHAGAVPQLAEGKQTLARGLLAEHRAAQDAFVGLFARRGTNSVECASLAERDAVR